ncbi:alpha-2-macroglobulin family protein [Desulforhabdus amnigena]|uniref:Alpha-2-macroglobulin n=1 Tax=Desulforhabdus amnigena TaxID=40218 RepID=A0A9W6FVQ4_9BACT|nr:alpha-2-macroglobulin family protein [Desulforhabdus amnigena]GLI35718.1 hypothetical protein DAMNIGENAA_31510 [Desulforhabdus amnigena]
MPRHPDISHLSHDDRYKGKIFLLSMLLSMLLSLGFLLEALPGHAKDTPLSSGTSGPPLKILRITPSGEDVPPGRQIVFLFDRSVVPLGRMERSASEIPITIEPQLNCLWRWLNPSTLACQLNEKDALLPATRYRISIAPGITAEDNSTLAQPVSHSFITERPRVTDTWFRTWASPGTPKISVRFNQPVTQASLAAHLFFQVTGGKRIPARVEPDSEYQRSPDSESCRVWIAAPQRELPKDASVSLRVEPGIVSTQGPEPGIENRRIDSFDTFPEFRFLGVECKDKANNAFVIRPGKATPSERRCLPSGGVSLLFSSPVLKTEIQKGLQITPPLTGKGTEPDPWEWVYTDSRLSEPYEKGKTYPVFLPEEILKPFTSYRLQSPSEAVKDEFGRPLVSPIDLPFATDHRAPDFALTNHLPILEKGLDTDAHLWAVNLDEIKVHYETLTTEGKKPLQTKIIKVPGPRDASIPVPLGIREMLSEHSGIAQGTFATNPTVPGKSPEDAWFFAQITPFQVHVKLGHYNTVVWVTDLQTGSPVPGVEVQILKETFQDFGEKPEILSDIKTGEDGVAKLAGTVVLDPELKLLWAYKPEEPRLFVRCQKGEDLAVLPLRYEFQVAAEGANREFIPDWLRPLHGHMRSWGSTAQGIYKVGDTIQFKIYVRNQDNLRFTPPPGADGVLASSSLPTEPQSSVEDAGQKPSIPASPKYRLKVQDPMGKVIYELEDIQISPFGAFNGEVPIPRNGAVGWYRFVLSANFSQEEWEPMRVLVSDFTPAPFRVTTDLNGKTFQTGDTVKVSTEAKLHAGGPYSRANVKVNATLDARPFVPENPRARGFQVDVLEAGENETTGPQTLYETQGTLSDTGSFETEFKIVETPVWYGQLTVESAVQDDRGKSIANRATATCFGRDRYVGLLQEDWVLQEGKPAGLRILVIDPRGNPVEGVKIGVKTEYEETKGARVKGAGNAYLTQYVHEWLEEEQFELVSTADPLDVKFTPKHAGTLRITAAIQDTQGRTHKTVLRRWVTGRGHILWESIPGNLLNIFPEKSDYHVGETARFLVQNPFPGARALITVERFGVLQSWVKTLESSTEIVEIPVLPDYLPGFYASVMVTSPRVEKPMGPGGEDLGKPTFRMGYVKVPVKDPYKEISVNVRPEKEVYKPRDTVTVNLEAHVRNPAPGTTPPPVELAVAVLDESVFDLLHQGSKAFDPYEGFYRLDELDLANFNLLMHLVGREKLELKGAGAGGGGGPDLSMRSVFKFVSYWNPSLRTDAEGKATIQFEVPDNLTGWRVLAMAVTPEDRMGLGEGVFRVNQSTEIRPALPNQVTEGDRFEAGFSLLNRTDETRTLEVTLSAEGPVEAPGTSQPLPAGEIRKGEYSISLTRQVTAEPYKRITVYLPVQTKGHGEITFTALAGDDKDRDGIIKTLKVLRSQTPETAASYGMTTDPETTRSITFPENMREDTGSLGVELSPTVIGGLEGAFEFLRDYPYACWEQRLSRGVMAAYYKKLKPYLNKDFSWDESGKAVEATLALAAEHQAPNGGMAYYVPRDEYADPYLSAFTALAFNWLKEEGHRPPRQVEEGLQNYLLNFLRHDATTAPSSKSMTDTVRAVALAALAEQGKVNAPDVLRYSDHVPAMSLLGKAFYLRALIDAGGSPKIQQDVLSGILAHADQSSGGILFSKSLDAGYRMLLTSPIRDNCVVLGSLLAYEAANPSDRTLGDIPLRLMRTIALSRKGKAHWASTQENLFAVKAMVDFARVYEKDSPDITVQTFLDKESLGEARFTAFDNPPVLLERALQAGDAGRKVKVRIEKTGQERLYYSTRLTYSPSKIKTDSINSGIEVHREYSVERKGKWTLLEDPMEIKTGEVVRVDLYVSLPAERYFVVVEDPVPGGLEPVSRDLATASMMDADKGEMEYPEGSYRNTFAEWIEDAISRWSFYHRELRHDAARFYSERLPAGRYHLSYSAQAVSPGVFSVLPLHAEEMYEPDVFGKGTPAMLRIQATDATYGQS